MPLIYQVITAVTFFVAAYFWFMSAKIGLSKDPSDEDVATAAEKLKRQNRLNAIGALFAAFSAFFQAAFIILFIIHRSSH